jgi:hypothetical protein
MACVAKAIGSLEDVDIFRKRSLAYANITRQAIRLAKPNFPDITAPTKKVETEVSTLNDEPTASKSIVS